MLPKGADDFFLEETSDFEDKKIEFKIAAFEEMDILMSSFILFFELEKRLIENGYSI